jgi:guanine deaminase
MDGMDFMRRAIALSRQSVAAGSGGPFGAVVVAAGRIVGEGCNQVLSTNDPTAHAEMVAIRSASATLGRFDLSACEIYASCEPCPMCLSAIYWARIGRIHYGNTRAEAAGIGFDDAAIYEEVARPIGERTLPMVRMLAGEARAAFDDWERRPDKVRY